MKLGAFGKLGLLNEQYRMVKQRHRQRNKSALALVAELGSESNAHGLAKIATSDKTQRKVMWALFVIIGFTAATLQLSLLVRKYLIYQVVEVSRIRDGMPVQFPAISICNIAAISLTKIKKLLAQETSNAKDWFNFTQMFNFSHQQERLTSIQGFYENMGKEAKMIGYDIKDFMLHCRFNQELCKPENFTRFFESTYYNCYTFNSGQLQEKILMHATGPQNGLSLIAYLDNDDPPLGAYGLYNIESNIANSAGVRIVIHAPNTMPSPVDHGFDIPPGYSTSVGLKALMHTRLSEPYGNCTTKGLKGLPKYTHTIFSCLALCKQKIVVEKCECKSSGLPDDGHDNVTLCGSIPNWKYMFHNANEHPKDFLLFKLDCEEKVLKKMANDRSYEIACQCFQPCHETSYQKSISLSYWPLEFYQYNALQTLYKETINETFLNEAYIYLETTIKEAEKHDVHKETQDKMSDKEKASAHEIGRDKQIRASNLIRQNLLRLNIYLEDLSIVEFHQMPAYELADLFADIGGTLGLWMGISVLTIMELMELVTRLILLLFNSENKREQDPVTNGMLEHDRDYFDHDKYKVRDFYDHEQKNMARDYYDRDKNTETPV